MKKIYPLFFFLALTISCRKDNSTFLNSSNNGKNCLIATTESLFEGSKTITTYHSNDVISSIEYPSFPEDNQYLTPEGNNVYRYSEGSTDLEDVKSRVYLNSFGAIEKQVKVTLNADMRTFTEVTEESNTFLYNNQQQLVNLHSNLNPDESAYYEFSYDGNSRIKEILCYEEQGGDLYLKINNFTFSNHAKKDNLVQMKITSSIGDNFIPSLKNAYITHYENTYEGLSSQDNDFEFNFDNNGALTKTKESYAGLDEPIVITTNYTLNCK